MPNQTNSYKGHNSYNNTYGALNEVSKKRSLVVMNALKPGANIDSVITRKPQPEEEK